jgi:indolepyruvate ferredoxin oxidoreductase
VNEKAVPTAAVVHDARLQVPPATLIEGIRRTSRSVDPVDALGISELVLGDTVNANVFLLGFAFQKGFIPLRLQSLDRALELNQVSLEENRRAFIWGRLVASDAKVLEELVAAQSPRAIPRTLDAIVEHRAAHLARYQDAAYAARYRALVERVRRAEQPLCGNGPLALSEAVARVYAQLLAYKDEYEVARLYTDGSFRKQLESQFEGDYRVEYQLAPPLFARRDPETGRLRKHGYGRWIVPGFRLLAALRSLRGTPLDVFGYLPERRRERAWIARYESAIEELLANLRSDNLSLARDIAALPEGVRGFDVVKDRNAEGVEKRLTSLLERFRAARTPVAANSLAG